MIWALKENKRNHSREKKPGGLIEIWRWCHPGRKEGGFWVENSLWEGGACSVDQGTQGKASAGALQTKARYCCRGQPSTAQSLVSWDGGSVFYMKCSEKSAKDWTCPCLDVWFHGWWVKITPSLMVQADMERQEKWQKVKRNCVSATWSTWVEFFSVPYKTGEDAKSTDGVSAGSFVCLQGSTFVHFSYCWGRW